MPQRRQRMLDFEGMRWQLAAITDVLGYDDVRKLCRDDLVVRPRPRR